MKTLTNLPQLSGKTVFVRVDFNVPLKEGTIRDDNRIVAALPTLQFLIKQQAKLVLLSHLGKIRFKDPEKLPGDIKKNNLAVVATRLAELLNQPVAFSQSTQGEELNAKVKALLPGGVLLVQNTRYEKGEEKNDPVLAQAWASLADAYVMDAFGSAHRAHASTYGIPQILKQQGKHNPFGCLSGIKLGYASSPSS
jgi:phosphoglycerate kinase